MKNNIESPLDSKALHRLAESSREDMVDFCQRMIQTPSLPGQEKEMAALVAAEMRKLQYDQVCLDAVGNVIGKMNGDAGRTIMLNSHLDHVDPGGKQNWRFDPYSGTIYDDAIWGRGASDTKGAIAVQVYAPAVLRQAGYSLPGDVYFTGVVLEEIYGLGTMHLVQSLRTDYALSGEATANQIARGHRGSVSIRVVIQGKSAHASNPGRAINPHEIAARFILQISSLEMSEHEVFGKSTLAPTLFSTDQTSSNVIPGEIVLTLDWRPIPEDVPEEMVARLQKLLNGCLLPGSKGQVSLVQRSLTTYTGHQQNMDAQFKPFLLPDSHPLVDQSRQILAGILGREVSIGEWKFATDGGHLVAAGIPTIGFSPCEEHLAHTHEDHVKIPLMLESLAGYMGLLLYLE